MELQFDSLHEKLTNKIIYLYIYTTAFEVNNYQDLKNPLKFMNILA